MMYQFEVDGKYYGVKVVVGGETNYGEYCELYEKVGYDEEIDPYEFVCDMGYFNPDIDSREEYEAVCDKIRQYL